MENFPKSKSPEQKINYPANLTERDIELVNEQCQLQGDIEKEDIEGFSKAYSEAKELAADIDALSSITDEEVEGVILRWAIYIEKRNQKGYRKTPAYFEKSARTGLDADKIERAMSMLVGFIAEYLRGEHALSKEDITNIYKEFELIHPFEDGNGRVGDLLWKISMARKLGEWPKELPPDLFDEREEGGSEKD
ncbi:MAG: Fic family protein [Candidatus Spechtbacterales bacterium]|nr:Fic family protein [Candidatus Spechtbacterales bacterium]